MSFGFGFGFPKRLTSGGGLSPRLYLDFVGTGVLPSTVTFSRGTNATLTDSNGRIAWAPHNLLTNSEDFEAAAWSKTNTTATANVGTAPDGTFTADKIAEDATTNPHQFANSPVMSLSTTYTLSIYAKAVERNWIILNIYTGVASCWTWFNVSAGTIGTVGAGATARIESVGNGWFRCSITTTTATSGFPNTAFWVSNADNSISYLGTTGSGILVWGAQLNVANAPVNLLTWSEDFSNGIWAKNQANIAANTVLAPDGALTADTITATSTNGYVEQSFASVAGTTYSLSFFAKIGNVNTVSIVGVNQGVVIYVGQFNLQTGTATAVSGSPTVAITDVGNGWYRCSVSRLHTIGNANDVIRFVPGISGATVANNFAYIWGAQLNTGSVALPYVATTSSIYLPPAYNSTTPKNLLGYTQEPENAAWTKSNSYVQQNLLTWSQGFDVAASWLSVASVTIVANTTTAPDGSITAERLYPTFNNNSVGVYQTFTGTVATYTLSFFAKAAGKTFLGIVNYAGVQTAAWFNLSNGTTSNILAGYTAAITDAGNGWYRCSITGTAAAAVQYAQVFVADSAGSIAVTVNGTDGIFLWGAQLVQGSTAGDYTQTTSAAAPTRYLNYDGTLTGRKLVENTATAAHSVSQNITAITGTPYVIYCYAKAAERQYLNLSEAGTSGWRASFDLLNGTVAGSGGTPSATIVSVGGGWYRCSILVTAAAAFFQVAAAVSNTATPAVGGPSYTGDGTSGIYVSDFQLSNSASVDPYVYNPQAAAASAAFYGPRFDYNPTGTPVLSGTELFVNPNCTDLTGFTVGGASPPTLTFDNGVKATVTVDDAASRIQTTTITGLVVGKTYLVTVTANNACTKGNLVATAWTWGTIPDTNFALGVSTRTFRVTATATSGVCRYYLGNQLDNDGNVATITQHSVQEVTGYTATANGLLIEEQRTNLSIYSEQLDNGVWSKSSNCTITPNDTTAPDGATTADKVVISAANTISGPYNTVGTLSGLHTQSWYVKQAATVRYVQLLWTSVGVSSDYANFDLQTGTLTAGTYSGANIQNVGNGWYRISLTSTLAAVAGGCWIIAINTSTAGRGAAYPGTGAESFFAWGVQVEAGSFATSYVPTQASQVTRNADSASMLGDNFYTWYNPNQGTLYAEYSRPFLDATRPSHYVNINDNTSNNAIIAYSNVSQQTQGDTLISGASQGIVTSSVSVTANTTMKQAYAVKTNSLILSVNGTLSSEDTSASLPGVSQMNIGNRPAGDRTANSCFRRIGYYNTRLPDSTLQALTTT